MISTLVIRTGRFMYTSLATLGVLAALGWMAYVLIPELDTWLSGRRWWKQHKAEWNTYQNTHHWDETRHEWIENKDET